MDEYSLNRKVWCINSENICKCERDSNLRTVRYIRFLSSYDKNNNKNTFIYGTDRTDRLWQALWRRSKQTGKTRLRSIILPINERNYHWYIATLHAPKDSYRTRQSKKHSSRCSIFGINGKIDSLSDSDDFGEEVIYPQESPKMEESF